MIISTKTISSFFLTACLLFLTQPIKNFAQAPQWKWATYQGSDSYDTGTAIAADEEGNFYVTGFFNSWGIPFGNHFLTHSNNGVQPDIFIVKYSRDGVALWAESIKGKLADVPNAIATDSDGSVYITGRTSSPTIQFGDITLQNTNGTAMFVAKYNPYGQVSWAKLINSLNEWGGNSSGSSITVDNEKNVFVAGDASGDSIQVGDEVVQGSVMVAKFDSEGNFLWSVAPALSLSVSADRNGNVLLSGSFGGSPAIENSNIIDSVGGWESFIIKYTPVGQVIWSRAYGGSKDDAANKVSSDIDGNVIVAGTFKSPMFPIGKDTLIHSSADIFKNDVFLAKLTVDGEPIWATSLSESNYDIIQGITTDQEKFIYVMGTVQNKILIQKLDPTGKQVWSKFVNANTQKYCGSAMDSEGHLLLTGGYDAEMQLDEISIPENGATNFFAAKLTSDVIMSVGQENNNLQLHIFPNPTASQFHISNLEPGNWTITIYTLDGQSVFKKEFTEANAMIDLSGKAKGAYVYQLLKDGEVFKSGKLVLE